LCARIREAIDSSDPELALERVDPALTAMVDAARHFGGTISQIRGDGVTVLFGAPVAHEDHAARACYAALAMRDAIASLIHPPLDVRIGIHSGEAVVRTIGDELSRHYDAIGPGPRLASLIDAALAPRVGLTTDSARRAEGFIELSPPETSTLDGVVEPVELFMLLAARAVAPALGGALGAAHAVRRPQAEIASSGRSYRARRAVRGTWPRSWASPAWESPDSCTSSSTRRSWLVGRCSRPAPPRTTRAPLISRLRICCADGSRSESATHLDAAESRKTSTRRRSLDRALVPMLPPLAALLDLPSGDPQWSTLSPPQQRQRTLEALKMLIVRESQARPLVLVVEDLHWTDPGTQAVLDHLIDNLAGCRVLLVLTHRPEYRHQWFAKSYFSQLRVEPLATPRTPIDSCVRCLAMIATSANFAGN
jgi:hypothetical protein